jgi:hypothetical protein
VPPAKRTRAYIENKWDEHGDMRCFTVGLVSFCFVDIVVSVSAYCLDFSARTLLVFHTVILIYSLYTLLLSMPTLPRAFYHSVLNTLFPSCPSSCSSPFSFPAPLTALRLMKRVILR